MKTIDKRATEYEESIGAQDYTSVEIEDAYFKGATDQKAIDIERAKNWLQECAGDYCGDIESWVKTNDLVKDFVKFMEEEK